MRKSLFIAAALLGAALHAPSADASARHIDAVCGMHRGAIVVPFKHRYHVRIGPKRAGGSYRCRGRVHHHTGKADSLSFGWVPFDLGSWTWRGVLDVGASSVFTASACSTFAAAMIGEIPTAGIDTPATVITGASCVAGGKHLQDAIRANLRPRG